MPRDAEGSHVSPQSWNFQRRLLWLGTAIVVAFLLVAKARISHNRGEEIAKETRADQSRQAASIPTEVAMNRLMSSGASRAAFQQQFASSHPHPAEIDGKVMDIPHYQRLEFFDPVTNRNYFTTFHDDRMCFWQGLPAFSSPRAEAHSWVVFRWLAAPIAGFSVTFWFLFLTFAVVIDRHRRILGEAMLAIAILCGAIWASDHSQATILLFEARRPSLGVDGGMMLISIEFIRWSLRSARDRGRCGLCGYDLTGNMSGICPECATLVPHREPRPDLDTTAENPSTIG